MPSTKKQVLFLLLTLIGYTSYAQQTPVLKWKKAKDKIVIFTNGNFDTSGQLIWIVEPNRNDAITKISDISKYAPEGFKQQKKHGEQGNMVSYCQF